MKTLLKFSLASALLLPAFAASAQTTPADLSIDASSLMITGTAGGALPPRQWLPGVSAGAPGPLDPYKKIVNLAIKIFKIIEKNRPVVDIATDYANAVPESVTNWTQLTGWQGPDSRTYVFTAKNLSGMEIVNASYKVHYLWGGSYKGQGRFLTGVTIEPVSIVTAWGCKLDVTADVPDESVVNAGTAEAPVASMDLHLRWKLKTFTHNTEQEAVYRVSGDGALRELGPLFTRGQEARAAAKIEAAAGQIRNPGFN